RYISGDMWNVNPITLKRIARLYCKNERAVIHTRLESGHDVVLVAVAAILVASIHLNWVDVPLALDYDGPAWIPDRAFFRKGQELGYFHHGCTIIVIAPAELERCEHVREGERIRMGTSLFRRG